MKAGTKKEGDALLDSLLSAISSQHLLKIILQKLCQEQDLQLPELIHTFQEAKEEASIPLPIFSYSLEPAEALYKFLKENEGLSFQRIAQELNRDQKSVWASYQRAEKKNRKKFSFQNKCYFLPLSLFKNRSYSILESVVFYLHSTHHLSNKDIAALLHKTPNTVAVLMKRARDKHQRHI